MAENGKNGVWDGRITVATLVTLLGILVGGVTFANSVSSKVDQLVNSQTETRSDVREMRREVNDMGKAMAGFDERLKNLEGRR